MNKLKLKIKRCPFCGSKATEKYNCSDGLISNNYIICKNCYTEDPIGLDEEESIKLWNIRHSPYTE